MSCPAIVVRRKQGKHFHEHQDHTETKNEKMGKTNKCCKLVSYDELPDYMKDNEYIHQYYRAEWPLKQAVFSLFRWHNETINVWTHLLGFIFFAAMTVGHAAHVSDAVDLFGIFRTFPKGAGTNTSHDSNNLFLDITKLTELNDLIVEGIPEIAARWPFYVYLSGTVYCLFSSAICHLFCCHSKKATIWLLRMDYTGIASMIIASFFPPVYYIFQCQPVYQLIYLSGITILGAVAIASLFSPSQTRVSRVALFGAMSVFGVIPATHGCLLNWNNPKRNLILTYEAVMALSYFIGGGFYLGRIPERWWPGLFDLAGHSHQLFHVFVVSGSLAHYGASLLFLEYRDLVGC